MGSSPSESRRKKWVLWISLAASFLPPFMASAVNVGLPDMGREFAQGASSLGAVASVFLFALAVCLAPAGKGLDLYGHARGLGTGCGVFALGCLGGALAPTFPLLLAARGLQGAGGALMTVGGVAILTEAFPPGERGRVLGVNVAAVYLGISLGPTLGGLLVDLAGWRLLFWVPLLPCGATLALLATLPGGLPRGTGRGALDGVSCGLFGLGLSGLLWGVPRLPEPRGAAALAAGAILWGVFARRQLRSSNPLLDLRLFLRGRAYAFSNLAALLHYGATYGVTFLLSLFLQEIRGLSPRDAGLLLAVQPVVQTLFSPLAGRLSDRFDPGRLASLGMGLTGAGLGLLLLQDTRSSLALLAAAGAVQGLGFAFFSSPNTNAILGSVGRGDLGQASATLALMRVLGQSSSMALVAAVLNLRGLGAVPTGADPLGMVGAMRGCFGLYAGLSVLGVFLSLARGAKESAP